MSSSYDAPNRRLTQELLLLAKEAVALMDAIKKANFKPPEFPETEIDGLCKALIALKDGSTEVAGTVLSTADRRLRNIRFNVVTPYDEEDPEFEPSALTRGEGIDASFKNLENQISAALEAYHAQTETERPDPALPDPKSDAAPPDIARNIDTAAQETVTSAHDALTDMVEHGVAELDPVQELKRGFGDAKSLGYTVQSQNSNPAPSQSGQDRLSRDIKNLPSRLERAGNALQRYGHAAEPIAVWATERCIGFIKRTCKAVVSLGVAMVEAGRRLDSGPPEQIPPRDEAAEAEVVRRMLAGERITPKLGRGVRVLDFGVHDDAAEIAYPEDLRHLPFLSELEAIDTTLTPADVLAAVSHAQNLTSLGIDSHGSERLEGMEVFTALTNLTLGAEDATNIDALKGITELTRLNLLAHNATNINALKGMTGIKILILQANVATNISALKGMTGIKELFVQADNVTNINALTGMTELRRLTLAGRNLVDISAIAMLTRLERLSLLFIDEPLETVPLAALPKLKKVTLSHMTLNTLTIPKGVEADIDASVRILDQM